ncbi:MAG TPA: hypothetical protein VFL91_08550, partial [Thermomicrobiales bacterium]|nr:hypothetical protein [Thermomicrobiales bacterium]
GFGDAFVVFNGPLVSGEVSRVHERTDNVAGNWNGDAGAGPVDEPGAQPTALTIGVYTPTLIAGGDAPDGTAHIWTADASAPFTFKRATYDQLIFGHIRDLIRDGQFDGLVYGQGETGLFKTVDNFVSTIYRMRDYPTLGGGRAGYMVGYGKLRDAAPPSGLVLVSVHPLNDTSAANSKILLLDSAGWHLQANHPAPDVDGAWGGSTGWARPIFKRGAFHYTLLTSGDPGDGFKAVQNVWRSADQGKTWTNLPCTGVKALDFSADGTGYAITQSGLTVAKTTNWGDTWTTLAWQPWPAPGTGGSQFTLQAVAVSPTDSGKVAVKWPGYNNQAVWLSQDGGATFPIGTGEADGAVLNNSQVLVTTPDGGGFIFCSGWGHFYRGTFGSASLTTLAAAIYANIYWPALAYQGDGSLLAWTQINAPSPGLYRSTDGAATWTRLYGQSGATFPSYNTDPGVTAGYIDGDGTIYTCNTRWNVGVAPTGPDATIVKLPAGSSTWEDLTPSLVTAFGVKYQAYTGGMASA